MAMGTFTDPNEWLMFDGFSYQFSYMDPFGIGQIPESPNAQALCKSADSWES